ncbi:phenylalanine--tRNA ligase subunit alpha [Candidatus Woesearchaeota archaeon]|nr:phenylalanine--tRNA ligase subunit alpha [Candidatus Woesearchaeota archaeon]
MELQSIVAKLHPLERAVLPALTSAKEVAAIAKAVHLQDVEVMRALQWLENKGILTLTTQGQKIMDLGRNGIKYQREGLPEKHFLAALSEEFKGLNIIIKKSKLSREEVNACIGVLKKKAAIEVQQGEMLQIKITPLGMKHREERSMEEEFLQQTFPLPLKEAEARYHAVVEELLRRKDFLTVEEHKTITAALTELGKKVVTMDTSSEVINRLTGAQLRSGSWKEKTFRAYDVESNVPRTYGGRKHFVTQATEYAKQVWLEMGFKEMAGPMVGTSFWCFDALFVPQDHPAREMQDTFFLGGELEKGELPEKKLVQKIKEVHEHGKGAESSGWQYSWNEEEARRNVLRTHTTLLSAQTLATLKEDNLPAKFFALGKNFRNEALDWKHLSEFNQTEGIVVDKDISFRHLLGYLKQFFRKMGFPKARFRPAYFPYTEPSIEIDVFHPLKKEWVELGGAGIFRPEVVVPLLGKDIPVLAWGPGFDRIILDYYSITDIRQLYQNDLQQLREMKLWLK